MSGITFGLAALAGGAILVLARARSKQHHLGWSVASRYRAHDFSKRGNTFYVVRHGNSEANHAGIISSDPTISTKTHGLTPRGEEQARRAGLILASNLEAKREKHDPSKIAIYCSDFLRTRQTAAGVASSLGNHAVTGAGGKLPVTENVSLRERYFGTLNGESDKNYEKVWLHDNNSCWHNEYNSESVASCVKRVGDLVLELDSVHSDTIVILVAHGDICQIAYTGFSGPNPPAWHRRGESLQTGSVTKLVA